MSQWLETWNAFLEAQTQPAFLVRYPELIKAGVQTNVSFERNMAAELYRFVNATA